MVVSGKILRASISPCPYTKLVNVSGACYRGVCTLVAKNSEGDLGSALYEETWMNRSTSYLATASAILWVPSI